jgi:type IV secretory pathway VirB2 component (pilin)
VKSDWRAIVVLVLAAAVLVLGSLAVYTRISGDKAPAKPAAATPAQKLQRFLAGRVTAKVASIAVVRCADAGAQTLAGVSYPKLYACPTLLKLKDGSGGCIGVMAAPLNDGRVVAIANPTVIDPRYCK